MSVSKEEFITKTKNLSVDFWSMNLHKGTFEEHFRKLVDEYEMKVCNHIPNRSDKKHTSCKKCGKLLQMQP